MTKYPSKIYRVMVNDGSTFSPAWCSASFFSKDRALSYMADLKNGPYKRYPPSTIFLEVESVR